MTLASATVTVAKTDKRQGLARFAGCAEEAHSRAESGEGGREPITNVRNLELYLFLR
jgi:hypothetical protein